MTSHDDIIKLNDVINRFTKQSLKLRLSFEIQDGVMKQNNLMAKKKLKRHHNLKVRLQGCQVFYWLKKIDLTVQILSIKVFFYILKYHFYIRAYRTTRMTQILSVQNNMRNKLRFNQKPLFFLSIFALETKADELRGF